MTTTDTTLTLDDSLAAVALRRVGVIAADPAAPSTPEVCAAAVAELAALGIVVANPAAVTDDLAGRWARLRPAAAALRGDVGVTAAPLFAGFPDQLPSLDDIELRGALTWCRLVLAGVDPALATIDEILAAADHSDLGWWPASSIPQDPARAAAAFAGQASRRSDGSAQPIVMRVASPSEVLAALTAWMTDVCASASSLPADLVADLRLLLDRFGTDGIDLATIRFTELRAVAATAVFEAALAGDADAAARFVGAGLAPDDLLRVVAELTDVDVSLAAKVRVPSLPRRARRLFLAALDAAPRHADMFRRRGLWLTVETSLHAGEFAGRYPRAAAAFATLRSMRRDHTTPNARLEAALSAGDSAALLAVVASNPTLAARNLRRIAVAAEAAGAVDALCAAIRTAFAAVPLRVLAALPRLVADNGATYPRLALTKQGRPMSIDHAPGHLAVTATTVAAVAAALDDALAAACADRGSWAGETLWVDPATTSLLVGTGLRSVSDRARIVERGSRIATDAANVVRLFAHWVQGAGQVSDLDLSAIAFDADFNQLGQVSWTNLANDAMVHSGDLTSAPAPHGAAEYLDIDLAAARAMPGWRYIAPSIYRYSGPAFHELPVAVAGWMLRDQPCSDTTTFDPATVADAFALTGNGGYAVPFCYDLVTGEILYVDAYVSHRMFATTETSATAIGALCADAYARGALRPSIAELALRHATARGATVVADRASATLTVGVDDDCTWNAYRPEQLLADLL